MGVDVARQPLPVEGLQGLLQGQVGSLQGALDAVLMAHVALAVHRIQWRGMGPPTQRTTPAVSPRARHTAGADAPEQARPYPTSKSPEERAGEALVEERLVEVEALRADDLRVRLAGEVAQVARCARPGSGRSRRSGRVRTMTNETWPRASSTKRRA